MASCSFGRAQLAFCEGRPAKMLLLAALKLEYCTLEPEWMATTPKVFDCVAGTAVVVAASEAANTMFLSCMMKMEMGEMILV